MHSLLEDYLAEVQVQLSPLPAKRRDEEMREMRQHLLNAVIVNREMGQNEDEAAANALAEFGTSGEAAKCLVKSWRQEKARNRFAFWAATGLVLIVWYAAGDLKNYLEAQWLQGVCGPPHGCQSWSAESIETSCGVLTALLTGSIAGLLPLKRVVAGAATVAAVFVVLVSLFAAFNNQLFPKGPTHFSTQDVCMKIATYLLYAFLMVAATWVISRWRKSRIGKLATITG